MRVVIDTNILVSFAIRPNLEFEILFDHLARHGKMLVSEQTLAELLEVLSRQKFRKYIPIDQSLNYVEWYAGLSELVVVNDRVDVCLDPKDNKFLELAISGNCDYIVTGDSHLLTMSPFRHIPIVSPTTFLRLVSA